jgi:hypothetical protein
MGGPSSQRDLPPGAGNNDEGLGFLATPIGARVGVDGGYFQVHHFARQLSSRFPPPAAIGARTSRIEIGTGVIDMRYENPSTWSRTLVP